MPPDLTEVPIVKSGQRHIADIIKRDGWVVELQHSPISPEEIWQRERFYGRMFWLFDIRDCRDSNGHWEDAIRISKDYYFPRRLVHDHRFDIRSKGNYWTFKWKHPRKHIATASNIFLDIEVGIFQIKKMYSAETPYSGWGYLWEPEVFTHWLRGKQ